MMEGKKKVKNKIKKYRIEYRSTERHNRIQKDINK
jgi:hypothetical protein